MAGFADVRRALVNANGSIVAIEERSAAALTAIGLRVARGEKVPDADVAAASGVTDDQRIKESAAIAQRLAAPMFIEGSGGKRVALISLMGAIDYSIEYQPYVVSSRLFARNVRELAKDESVKAVVVVVNSPGGIVTGTPEAADAMYLLAAAKKVTAVVDTMAASAAYWIVSQASDIVCLPSGMGVGSIGVRMMHLDCSAMWAAAGINPTLIYEGNAFEPLGDEAKARYQLECKTIYDGFVKAVARGRGVSVAKVRDHFGQGRLLMPQECLKLGMLDRLEEPEAAIGRLLASALGSGRYGAQAAELAAPVMQLTAPPEPDASAGLSAIFEAALSSARGGRAA